MIPTPLPLPPLPTGIFDGSNGISPVVFRANDEWQGPTSVGFRMVYAGTAKNHDTGADGPGAVSIYSIPTDDRGAQSGAITFVGDFDAPDGVAGLTINGAN
jgi:hypothetical protein